MINKEELITTNPRKHILHTKQFDKKFIQEIFTIAKQYKNGEKNPLSFLKEKIVVNLFFEPSTRTRFSFESAAHRLHMRCISTENAKTASSAAKGESLADSITVSNFYGDFIILRHADNSSIYEAAQAARVPLINAGNGTDQHPTQALLDLFTIYEKFGRVENMKITMVGDLLRGRTVESLTHLLSDFPGNTFHFIAPDNSKIKPSLRKFLKKKNIAFTETDSLKEAIQETDICYMTRVQKERFDNEQEYENAKDNYILTQKEVSAMREDAIILHPLPRLNEIHTEIDSDPRTQYFTQAANGVCVRMALLTILGTHWYEPNSNRMSAG